MSGGPSRSGSSTSTKTWASTLTSSLTATYTLTRALTSTLTLTRVPRHHEEDADGASTCKVNEGVDVYVAVKRVKVSDNVKVDVDAPRS